MEKCPNYSLYCERFPNETSVYFQPVYCRYPLIKSSEYLCEISTGRMGSRAERPERENGSNGLVMREKEPWLQLEVARVLEMTVDKLNS